MFKTGCLFFFGLLCISSKTIAQAGPVLPSKKEMAEARIANAKKAAAIQFQYFVIKGVDETYGYSVYADGSLYIQQTTIPAIKGNLGFADTTSAGKVARLVIAKIKNGDLPPTITIGEMRKLKAIQ